MTDRTDVALPKAELTRPVGDTGLIRYSGYISDPELRKLTGPYWTKVVTEMTRTPVVGAALFAITQLIRRSEFTMEPADESAEAAEIAEFIDECRGDMAVSWEDALSSLLTFLPYGYSVHEIVYRRDDDGRIRWADWSPRPQDTIVRWVFDTQGMVVGVVQQAPMLAGEVILPLAVKCIHLVSSSRNRSPQGESVLLPAFEAWKTIRHIQYYEAVGIERELAGYPYMKVPDVVFKDPAALASYTKVVEGIRLNEQAGALIPSNFYEGTNNPQYELALLTTGGQRAIDTNTVISRYQADLVETVLAGFITIGHGTTGTYALASEKTRLFNLALQSWLDAIAEAITKQAIRPLVELNGWDVALAPTLHAGAPDNADLARDGAFVKALLPLINRMADEDQERLYSHLAALADWPEREQPFEEQKPPPGFGPDGRPLAPDDRVPGGLPEREQDADDEIEDESEDMEDAA